MTLTADKIHSKMAELVAPGSFFSIGEVEVNGQMVKQFDNAAPNLLDILQQGRAHGDKDCMVYEGDRWSFNEFYAQADAINAALQHHFRLQKGERVAIAMRNYPEWGSIFFGASFAGSLVVPLNSWGQTEELLFGVTDSESKILFCDQARYQLIENEIAALDLNVVVVRANSSFQPKENVISVEALIESVEGKEGEIASVDPEDIAMMLYTSGSTGSPKGVPLTHRAASQAIMNYFFAGALTLELDGADENAPEQMANLLCVPLFHGTGLFAGLLVAITMGIKTVMMYKWDPVGALKLVEQEKITQTNAVPALVQALLSSDHFDEYDTSSLRRVGTGGSAAPSTLPELVKKRLQNPSCGTGWGMTETCVLGVSMGGACYDLKPNATGIKSPIIDLRITGEDGQPLAVGETGEIECKGVTVFQGYWKKPEASKKTFNGEWLQTGDVGYIDADGYLFITGRSKDLVIRGGENIFPGEIEDACYTIDGVMEVAVYGVPDDALGEELSMEIALKPGSELQEQYVREQLAKKVAGFKVPRYIVFHTDPLPKNVSNKIDKLSLRKAWPGTT